MKDVVFLSGLPRTGSTVLASMLNQHPAIHATTTSPVADLVSIVLDSWPSISGALKDPHPRQFGDIIESLVHGAHRHITKDVVVDKNRLWPRFSPTMLKVTGVKPKIICTVRSVTDIMASYILLIERNRGMVTFIDRGIIDKGLPVNNKNRCEEVLTTYFRHPYESLRIGYKSAAADMLMVEYDDIVANGQGVVDSICRFIGCTSFKLESDQLQRMDENDKFHGGITGLHDVRPVLQKTSPPAVKVLGQELYNYYTAMRLEFWRDTTKL